MSEEIIDDNDSTQTGERPTFLTVLCILTFIGSGLGVLGGLLGLVGVGALGRFAPAAGGMMVWQLTGLAAAALCLTGAIQMWNLKKMGFNLYVAGVGIAILTSIISVFTMPSVGGSLGSSVQGAVWTGVFLGVAINVAFVLMYNANRKYLIH